ncbi:MAG: GMP synthase (glutamine-hydrolyzing), partial [Candidatus Omnitrophota bacterium]
FEQELKKSTGSEYVAKGTRYSDANKPSAGNKQLKIKTIEPLKDLFKDEIKVVAKELGLPDSIIFRQPFPESGLSARIAGEVTPARLKILREANQCLVEEIKDAGIYEQVWQSFAILIPPENVIVIRCVASTDGISADWVRLPYDILDKIARKIMHKVSGISRVVYDISSKPPAGIEW